jgi:hypothetical protein
MGSSCLAGVEDVGGVLSVGVGAEVMSAVGAGDVPLAVGADERAGVAGGAGRGHGVAAWLGVGEVADAADEVAELVVEVGGLGQGEGEREVGEEPRAPAGDGRSL